jgi:hypothetical protein
MMQETEGYISRGQSRRSQEDKCQHQGWGRDVTGGREQDVDIVRLCSSLYWWDYEEAPVTLQLVLRGT